MLCLWCLPRQMFDSVSPLNIRVYDICNIKTKILMMNFISFYIATKIKISETNIFLTKNLKTLWTTQKSKNSSIKSDKKKYKVWGTLLYSGDKELVNFEPYVVRLYICCMFFILVLSQTAKYVKIALKYYHYFY